MARRRRSYRESGESPIYFIFVAEVAALDFLSSIQLLLAQRLAEGNN